MKVFCTLIGIGLLSIWISCSEQAESVDKNVFHMNLAAGLKTLDPAFAGDKRSTWMTAQVYNGLLELDSALHSQALLAKSWEISEDGLSYTFRLRDGVFFHKDTVFCSRYDDCTREVIASDFVYSFTRICDPKTASSGAWIFKGKIAGLEDFKDGKKDYISGFSAPNDSTFVIRLTKTFPPLLGLLAMPYCYVLPQEAVEYYGQVFRRHPVGTGAFRFFRWAEGHRLIFHRNPNYFEQDSEGKSLPYLDAVDVSFIPGRLSAFVEFLQGNMDLVDGLDDAYKDEVLNPDGTIKTSFSANYRVKMAPQLNIEYLGILMDTTFDIAKNHPFKNKLVRQAINYAIDRKKMVRYLLNGVGYEAESGFVPKGMPGFDPVAVSGYTYDMPKALALLKQAGYPQGKGLPKITLYSTPLYGNISEFIQKSFEQIGIKMEIQNMQGGSLRSKSKSGQLNLWRASWIADYPDGENYFSLFYSPYHTPNGPNVTHFHSAKFDSLYDAAKSITTDSLRFKIYQQMDRIIIEEAPVIPIYYDRSFRILQKNIHGLAGNPMNHLQLKRTLKR